MSKIVIKKVKTSADQIPNMNAEEVPDNPPRKLIKIIKPETSHDSNTTDVPPRKVIKIIKQKVTPNFSSVPKTVNTYKSEDSPITINNSTGEKPDNRGYTDIIKFFGPKDPNFQFSNYAEGYPITIDGVKYPTTEHYYQAQKYIYNGNTLADQEYAALIISQSTPNKAKILATQKPGKQNFAWVKPLKETIQQFAGKVHLNPEWDSVKVDVMRKALFAKFSAQNPKLVKMLLATNDALLMEDAPNDSFWGIGKDGKGQNWLGKLLMERREELRKI